MNYFFYRFLVGSDTHRSSHPMHPNTNHTLDFYPGKLKSPSPRVSFSGGQILSGVSRSTKNVHTFKTILFGVRPGSKIFL